MGFKQGGLFMVKKFLVFLIIFLLLPSVNALLLVTNSIDLKNAKKVIDFWKDNGLEVRIILANEYKSIEKVDELTVILGGPDSPEGIGDVVRNILTIEEQEKIREDKGVFIKDYKGSKVIIFAGADRNKTKEILFLKKNIIFIINVTVKESKKILEESYSSDNKSTSKESKIVVKGIGSVKINETCRIVLYAEDFEKVGALQLRIEYNPDILRILNVEKGNLSKNALMTYNIDSKNGITRIVLISLNGISGNGELIVLDVILLQSYFEIKVYIEDITDIYNSPISRPTIEVFVGG